MSKSSTDITRKRHSIDVNEWNGVEKPLSAAFKLWLGAYALVILAGFVLINPPL